MNKVDEKHSIDIIIKGDYLLPMDERNTIIEQGAVAIDGDKIVAVGEADSLINSYKAKEVIRGEGKILIPGLINGHTHSPMSLFRGFADDLPLMTWLNEHIFPAEAALVDKDFIRSGSLLGFAEMLMSGTTTFVDMYFYADITADLAHKAGIRSMLGVPCIDFPAPGTSGFDQSFDFAKAFIRKWKNKDDLITPVFAPHSPYTVSQENLQAILQEALDNDIVIHTHIAETAHEVAESLKATGKTPVEYLNSFGFFDASVIAAHMVHLTEADIVTAKEKNIGAIHNPTSNLKLASGFSPVHQLLDRGVSVGLGSDGAASNNNVDMWQEVHLTALIHKGKEANPEAVSAKQALSMATCLGAKAIHQGDKLGQLKSGYKADMIQVDYTGLLCQPMYNPFSHLAYVFTAEQVALTMIGGKVVMKDRQLLPAVFNDLADEIQEQAAKVKHWMNNRGK
ncbi:MAG: amidohydrolase family protein [Cellvibrionales bacterium]|nr:amidohydrolase family protein [Cellvibrionales bacterium]